MTRVKAICMFSGGLDSILAAKLILDQGIEVEAVHFVSAFSVQEKGKGDIVAEAAKQLGIPLTTISVGNDYLRVIRNPKHGYGKNMNPCVDCRIFLLKKAKKYARKVGASFIFTGEVLDERPMSQHYKALKLVEEESGLKGRLLRPLSAKLLPETEIEKKGLVDREKLLAIRGRSRKPQIKLAEEYGIASYMTPAGGCLLTCKEYADKLRDLFQHKKRVSMADAALLKVGRHFRLGKNKIIVGRNETENKVLAETKSVADYFFEVADVVGPITILQGPKTKKAVETAAALTAFYSDAESDRVTVNYGRNKLDKRVVVPVPSQAEVARLRVGKC
ncbi:MAG: 7-cyano-7-deazaguanine synthase [Candidatus Bathyarchaeota archaeon]|nr:7-cyano-7-deazaguanine synthase [Candidatus Bathyarchaeota archaeon]